MRPLTASVALAHSHSACDSQQMSPRDLVMDEHQRMFTWIFFTKVNIELNIDECNMDDAEALSLPDGDVMLKLSHSSRS